MKLDRVDVGRVLARLGIVATLKGREWTAACPNPKHDDSKPSFRVRHEPGGRKHGFFKCFASDTLVMTPEGSKPIGELAGKSARVLTMHPDGRGEWVDAPVVSFGSQEIWRLTLSRNGVRKVVKTTAEHGWFRFDNGKWRACPTSALKPGHRLRQAALPKMSPTLPSPWGIAAGLTFGDGSLERRGGRVIGARACMWGEKDRALLKFFPNSPTYETSTINGVCGKIVNGLPQTWKSYPRFEEGRSYLYGWLAGYFAADGHVKKSNGSPLIASARREDLEFVERLCLHLGIVTYGIRMQMRTGAGKHPTPLYFLSFRRSTLTPAFFLIPEHRARFEAARSVKERPGWSVVSVERTDTVEEVFCAVVEGTRNFALDGHLNTSNCWPCNWGGGLLDLVRWRLSLEDYEAAAEWIRGSGDAELAPEVVDVRADVVVAPSYPKLLFRLPAAVIEEPFERWPTPPARYWTEKRGLEPWQVERWGIGYAVSGRLGGRIVIPSRDSAGRPHSYTARDFTDSGIRYLQPEPSERARLSVMFGEQHWPAIAERADATLVLVEGEINGLAAEADLPGIYFGAAAGNQLRELHATKICTWGRLLTMTDPDDAGDDLHSMVVAATARSSTWVERLRLPEDPEINDAAKMRVKRPGMLRDILIGRLGG